jgi:hypothetical protein
VDWDFPAQIKAGLTFSHLATLADYPAPAWSLSVVLRGPSVIDLVAVAEGAAHRLTAPATETAAYAPGVYAYSVRAASGDDVEEVAAGTVTILADLAQLPAGTDARTENRKALDAIDAVIAQRASLDQQRYRINNRELYRMTPTELFQMRAYFASRVAGEEAKARGKTRKFGRDIRMRLQ